MAYIPSYFIAQFTPKELNGGDPDKATANFREIAQTDPDLSLETNQFTLHLSKSSSTQFANSLDGQVTLLLHGEIYSGPIADVHLTTSWRDT